MEEATYVQDILIGDCLNKDEAEDIINFLRKDANLQELLADAQLRSEQHRYQLSCQHFCVIKIFLEKTIQDSKPNMEKCFTN